MESPQFYPEQDPDHEVITELRTRLVKQTGVAFAAAERLSQEREETYIKSYPLEVPDVEVEGIMLTGDGRRPYMGEWDKEYLMLFRPLEENTKAEKPPAVWIKDRRRCTDEQGQNVWFEEHRYLLNELGLQPYKVGVEGELPDEITGSPTEATELSRIKERLNRFNLTPLQEPPRDRFSEQ